MTKKLQTTEKLVEVHGEKLTTTSLIIATNCDLQHKNVIALIRKFQSDFEELGRVAFETRPFMTAGGEQKQEIARLNESQATYLITLFRNTDIVRQFKLELVKEFWRMREILSQPNRQLDIQEKRDVHFPMMDALMFAREAVGKKTTTYHFTNENLFCNRALTGKREALNESDLDVYDLRLLKAIRLHNMVLMQHNLKQADRKDALDKYVTTYRAKNPRLKLVISK